MKIGTFSCNACEIKFQLIGISTKNSPIYCPYCGKDTLEMVKIIFG
jgi:hypothetical protein